MSFFNDDPVKLVGRYAWLILAWACLCAGPALAEQGGYPLGGIAGRGTVEAGSNALTLTWLAPGGAGDKAGLRVGDRIVGVLGTAMPAHAEKPELREGPLETLGYAIDRAMGQDGQLALAVMRGGERVEIEVQLRKLGSFGPTYPYDCDRSQQMYEQICVRMADRFEKGQIKGGKVTLALSALTLLGHQTGRYDAIVGDYARKLADEYAQLEDFTGKSVWLTYHDGIVLCEYYLIDPDPPIAQAIARIARALSEHIPSHGRYGHGLKPLSDTGDIAYGRQGLNATTTGVLWFYASAMRCGIDPEPYRSGFDKALARIRAETNANGGIGYAWGGDTQSPLRSGQAGLAYYHLLNTTGIIAPDDNGFAPYARQVGTWPAREVDHLMEAHAVSSIGVTSSLGSLAAHDRDAYVQVMQRWRWYFALCWEPATDAVAATTTSDGSGLPTWWAGYVGGKGNVGGDYYLNGHRELHDPAIENFIMPATVGFVLAASHQRLSFYGGFPAIPGVNYNLLTHGLLRRGYNLLRAGEHARAMAVFESVANTDQPQPTRQLDDDLRRARPDLALGGNSQQAARETTEQEREIARLLYDYIDQQIAQPAFAQVQALTESGDLYLADQAADDFAKQFDRIDAYRDALAQLRAAHLESPDQRRLIRLGRQYYDLESNALERPSRYIDRVKHFIEQNGQTYYGEKARELLKVVQAADTQTERNQQELRDAIGPTLIR